MRGPGKTILGALAVILAGAVPVRADLKSGVAAFKTGDYKTAHREFTKAAAEGNANAQFNLAILYLTGRGVERDVGKAVEWHLKAAAQGLAAAEHGLGVFYYQGLSVKQDYAQALVWFRRAAAKGFPDAEFNIGVMYFNSQGVRRDDFEVVKWVTLAASRKFAPAEYRMGQMYENGVIFAKDLSAALHWYRLAASHGNKKAPPAVKRVSKALNLPVTAAKPKKSVPIPKRKPRVLVKTSSGDAVSLPPTPSALTPPTPTPENKFAITLPAQKVKQNTISGSITVPDRPAPHGDGPDNNSDDRMAAKKTPAKSRDTAEGATGQNTQGQKSQEWRVQLASFRTPAEAERAWAALARRAGDAMGATPRIIARADLGDRGVFHRLQAGPLKGRNAAHELCDRIRKAAPDQGCLPIRSRTR